MGLRHLFRLISRFIHGEPKHPAAFLAIHLPSLAAAVFTCLTLPMRDPVWLARLLVFALVWDLVGGTASVASRATRAHHHARPAWAWSYLGVHAVQPFLLVWLFHAPWEWGALVLSVGAGLGALGFALRRAPWTLALTGALWACGMLTLFFAYGSALGGAATALAVIYAAKTGLLFPQPTPDEEAGQRIGLDRAQAGP